MMNSSFSWNSFGASVIGPGHISTATPNQDSWLAFHQGWGDGIAVADGVGSKSHADFGSSAACQAVKMTVRNFADSFSREQILNFPNAVLSCWTELVVPLDPRDCSSTCLYAFRSGDGLLRIGMIGDGCAAAVKIDGRVSVLSENKDDGFTNITIALNSNVNEKSWKTLDVRESECRAIVLCTDGVSDDLENVEGFILGFVEAHRNLARLSASRRTREMLENWPAPKHSDDKTIVCLMRVDEVDE